MKRKQEDIGQYFFIDDRIKKTRERMEDFKQRFETSNYYTCIQEINNDVRTVAFNIELEVTNYVSALQKAEQHIKALEFKKHHFNQFMQGLSYSDKRYLINRYKHENEAFNNRLDKLTIEEIKEIERAVEYRFGKSLR